MSPYKALYRKDAPTIPHYSPKDSTMEVVNEELNIRENALLKIKAKLRTESTD